MTHPPRRRPETDLIDAGTVLHAILTYCPDAELIEVEAVSYTRLISTASGLRPARHASFRSWSFSKEPEYVSWAERAHEVKLIRALEAALPGWLWGRDDKNYFSGVGPGTSAGDALAKGGA